MVSSEALLYETEQNPLVVRREHAYSVLAGAKITASINDRVEERAFEFVKHGIKSLDALHLALAEASGADFFCTCDDRLLNRGKQLSDLRVKVVSPIELVEEIET